MPYVNETIRSATQKKKSGKTTVRPFEASTRARIRSNYARAVVQRTVMNRKSKDKRPMQLSVSLKHEAVQGLQTHRTSLEERKTHVSREGKLLIGRVTPLRVVLVAAMEARGNTAPLMLDNDDDGTV